MKIKHIPIKRIPRKLKKKLKQQLFIKGFANALDDVGRHLHKIKNPFAAFLNKIPFE